MKLQFNAKYLHELAPFASTDMHRPHLAGVCVQPHVDGLPEKRTIFVKVSNNYKE